ncbi:MAG: helix-turn-helix domain-containing protein [Anaerolineae bacterium]|jgi:excisionase family DNA binding protein|nr:helix-turn-helix domain-containing protein [Anaerolineae bacterium]
MPETFNPTEWITTSEAAKLTEYAAVHLRQLAQRGKIKALKKGRDWLLNKASVLAYAKRMQQLGAEKHSPWRTGARQKDAKAQ